MERKRGTERREREGEGERKGSNNIKLQQKSNKWSYLY